MSENPNRRSGGCFKDIVLPVIAAFILVYLFRTFVVGMYFIPSESMLPTLEVDDYVIVTKFSYRDKDPERQDVVVFKYPPNEEDILKQVDYVKRVIGLPGDTLEIRDNAVYVNGERIQEPYLASGTNMPDFGPVEIPADQFFMMGDNRNNSNDSRYWGTVGAKYIVGKAHFIYWPLDRIGQLQ